MRTLQFDPALARPLFSSLDQIHLVMINPVGPGVHGKDFWQTDYDAATKTWSLTFNVAMGGASSKRIALSSE